MTQPMKSFLRHGGSRTHAAAVVLGAACALALLSCATVNRLGEFDVEGKTLAAEMRLPPEPEMDISYHLKVDFSDPIGTAVSVGSNIAKAANAQRVDALMRGALETVDVPGIVREESYAACLTVLGTQREDDPGAADYLLDVNIHRYGIHAGSWNSAVTLRIKLTASLYHNAERAVVWRRDIDVERAATPAMFGLDSTIGTFVTTAALAGLSEEDLQNGFDQLARDTALSVARTLQDDLYNARYGS
jgi:hypothetical protein